MKTILKFLLLALTFSSALGEIKPKETLQITITGVPVSEQGRLNSSYPVSASGYIEMWNIGKVKAAGLSEDKLASNIASMFQASGIYSNPVFQVMNSDAARAREMKEQEKQREAINVKDTLKLTVGGQVLRAGQQQWTKGMTIYAAVQSAGGENPFGAINRVLLTRNGVVYTYDLRKSKQKGVLVYPNDIIDVPKKNWRGL